MGNELSVKSELSTESGIFQLLLNKFSEWMTFKIFAVLLLVLIFLFKRSGCCTLCELWGSFKRKTMSVGQWIVNKVRFVFCVPGSPGSSKSLKGHTVLYYCQNNDADERFQTFCGQFLPDLPVKKFEKGDNIPKGLCMILLLPNDNRQNNADVLCHLIKDNMTKYDLKDNQIENITLTQISFDGNNTYKPPNLMNEDIFETINLETGVNFLSFINITYSDENNFERCTINKTAARKLRLLLN